MVFRNSRRFGANMKALTAGFIAKTAPLTYEIIALLKSN
jgi:hypothetical protein